MFNEIENWKLKSGICFVSIWIVSAKPQSMRGAYHHPAWMDNSQTFYSHVPALYTQWIVCY